MSEGHEQWKAEYHTEKYILQHLRTFRLQEKYSDCIIIIAEEKFYLQKLFLEQCGYFRNLFEGNWKDSGENVHHIKVVIPELKPKLVHLLWDYLYTEDGGIIAGLGDNELLPVLELAFYLGYNNLGINVVRKFLKAGWKRLLCQRKFSAQNFADIPHVRSALYSIEMLNHSKLYHDFAHFCSFAISMFSLLGQKKLADGTEMALLDLDIKTALFPEITFNESEVGKAEVDSVKTVTHQPLIPFTLFRYIMKYPLSSAITPRLRLFLLQCYQKCLSSWGNKEAEIFQECLALVDLKGAHKMTELVRIGDLGLVSPNAIRGAVSYIERLPKLEDFGSWVVYPFRETEERGSCPVVMLWNHAGSELGLIVAMEHPDMSHCEYHIGMRWKGSFKLEVKLYLHLQYPRREVMLGYDTYHKHSMGDFWYITSILTEKWEGNYRPIIKGWLWIRPTAVVENNSVDAFKHSSKIPELKSASPGFINTYGSAYSPIRVKW